MVSLSLKVDHKVGRNRKKKNFSLDFFHYNNVMLLILNSMQLCNYKYFNFKVNEINLSSESVFPSFIFIET